MATVSTTSLKLDKATKERVQRLASARRRSPHQIMREAVEQYVEREEKREQLRKTHSPHGPIYQTTGLHLHGQGGRRVAGEARIAGRFYALMLLDVPPAAGR